MCGKECRRPRRVAARHPAFGCYAVDTCIAPRRLQPRRIALRFGSDLISHLRISCGQVFQCARDFAEAKAMLSETLIALPAIYLLAGLGPDEACVIERLPDRAHVISGPVCAANAWVATPGASEWVSCVWSPATNKSGKTPEKGAGNLANSPAAFQISLTIREVNGRCRSMDPASARAS
jgi:hypothetical protein